MRDIEFLTLGPGHRPGRLAAGARGRARRSARGPFSVVGVDDDPARLTDTLARLTADGAAYGIRPTLEPISYQPVSRVADAAAIARAAGAAVLLDALHIQRGGSLARRRPGAGTRASCRASSCATGRWRVPQTLELPAELPLGMKADGSVLQVEARVQREVVGEGGFPLAELLAAVPAGTPISVEVPHARLQARLSAHGVRHATTCAPCRRCSPGRTPMSESTWDDEVDLLVLGTGAGGLAAAVTGADEGLSTLVLEKTEFVGGTTAYSAGTCWIPGNRFQQADGVTDDVPEASRYLDALVGDRAPRELREAYLARGGEMVEYLDRIGVRFWHSKKVVDYHPEIPGSARGRALEPQTFDGRTLGREDFGRIRRPVPEFALFGGTLMVRRPEVNELLGIFEGRARRHRAWRAHRAAAGRALGGRPAALPARHPAGHGQRAGGEPVPPAPASAAAGSGSPRPRRGCSPTEGRVVGAVVAHQGRELRVRARRGVVLAGGGFAASPDWRARYLPSPTPQYTRAGEGSTGDTLALAQAVGGALGEPRDDNAFWFPSSIGRRRDGSTAVFPHIWDRAKPGIVAVNAAGRRFVDESVSYHRFTRAMYDSHKAVPTIPAWLVIDAGALRRYGLGMIRPHTPAPVLRKYRRRPGTCTAARRCGSWRRRSASTRTAWSARWPTRTGSRARAWTRSSARAPACSATSTATPRTRPTSTSARSRRRRSTRSRWCRRRWAPRSGCGPTRPRGCSTRPGHRSRGSTRAATTRSR